ncbi:MAG: DUF350 domain-containing protein [Candidatus Aminicenantes bacterium]|nr:DUF350 domain-containing protein [Candidatus Aminicenantes bacterium]
MFYETPDIQFFSTIIYLVLILFSAVIAIMGSILIISFFTGRAINEKEEIVANRNIGMALVLGSFIWTIGRMCFETVKPTMNAWYSAYSAGFNIKTALKLTLGILGSQVIALIIGAVTIYISVKGLMIFTRGINEWEEIKNGNNAVAIIISVTVVVVGMFFESIISTIVVNLFDY